MKTSGFSIFFFLVLCEIILFAILKSHTRVEIITKLGLSEPILVTGFIASAVVLTLKKYLKKDSNFLRSGLSERSIQKVTFLKFSTLGYLIFFILLCPALITVGWHFVSVLLILITLVLIASIIPFLGNSDSEWSFWNKISLRNKNWFRGSSKIRSLIYLNALYMIRKNKKPFLLSQIYFLILTALMSVYIKERVNQDYLLLLPFFPIFLTLLTMNAKTYLDLKYFIFESKRQALLADFIFWAIYILILVFIVLVSLFVTGITFNYYQLLLIPMLYVLLSYCLLIKFKFLDSDFQKAINLILGISLPILIPFYFISLLKETFFGKR